MGEAAGIQSTGMTVGVLGAGTMGSGIATVMARAGHRTIVREVSHERAAAGVEQVRRFLDRSVERANWLQQKAIRPSPACPAPLISPTSPSVR